MPTRNIDAMRANARIIQHNSFRQAVLIEYGAGRIPAANGFCPTVHSAAALLSPVIVKRMVSMSPPWPRHSPVGGGQYMATAPRSPFRRQAPCPRNGASQ